MIEMLNDIGYFTTIVQTAFASIFLFLFRFWFTKEDEFRKNIKYHKEKKLETICESLQDIFERERDGNIHLRGERGLQKDLLISHTRQTLETSLFFYSLKRKQVVFQSLNTALLICIIIGGLMIIFVGRLGDYVFLLTIFSIVLFFLQLIFFFVLRKLNLDLNRFEEL